jgi:hypothetical protein
MTLYVDADPVAHHAADRHAGSIRREWRAPIRRPTQRLITWYRHPHSGDRMIDAIIVNRLLRIPSPRPSQLAGSLNCATRTGIPLLSPFDQVPSDNMNTVP